MSEPQIEVKTEATKTEQMILVIDGPVADWKITDPVELDGQWSIEVRRKKPLGNKGDRVATIYSDSEAACIVRARIFCRDGLANDLFMAVYNGCAAFMDGDPKRLGSLAAAEPAPITP